MKTVNIFWGIAARSIGGVILFLAVACGVQAPVEETIEEPVAVLDRVFYSETWTWPYQPELLAQMGRGKFYIPVQDEDKIAIIDPDLPDYGLKFVAIDFVQPNHIWITPGMRYAYITFQSETKGDHDAMAVLDTWTDEIVKYVQTGTNDPYHGAYSPTENIYVVGDLDHELGRVHLFDTETHELITSIETNSIQTRDVIISHDGRYAFIGHQGYDLEHGLTGSVEVLDIATQEIVKSLGEGSCRAGKMSYDGRLALFSCDDLDQIVAIEVATRTEIKRIELPEGSGPFNMAFRPDDKFVYVGLNKVGMLGIIDVEKLELVKALESGTNTNATYFHPYAPLAVTTNNGTDAHVSIIDTEKNEIIDQIETGGKGSHNGQWSPDGRWFIVNSRLGDTVTLLAYNDETGQVEWVDDIVVGFGPNGVRWAPYFCDAQFLTVENVKAAKNAPAMNDQGDC